MKWVTLEHIHLDRVATPWLIKRFIDPEADFYFLAAGDAVSADAIPFAIPGAELGPHDDNGSTFRKVLHRYEIRDTALDYLAGIIEAGIDSVLHPIEHRVAGESLSYREGIGLRAFAEGMAYSGKDDHSLIAESESLYDALYIYCRAKVLENDLPPEVQSHPVKRMETLNRLVAESLKIGENSEGDK